jgi:hypothetical protein
MPFVAFVPGRLRYNRNPTGTRRNGLTDADKAPAAIDADSEAKPQSFALAEMITCEECLRANPPTRTNCLYCAAPLPLGDYARELQTAREASNEAIGETSNLTAGFYVVLAAGQAKAPAESSFEEIATVLHLQPNEVGSVLGLNRPVPLLRAATFEQGTMLADKLRTFGLEVNIFREDTLQLETPTKKIRALEFADDGLFASLMSGERIEMSWNELSLMVIGRLMVNRKENEERRRRGRSQPVDSRELFSDEPVVDLYTKSDAWGSRISANSFDFSCLGDRKAMTAFENLTTLVNLLKTRAPEIEFDDSYRSLRAVLNNVWPLEPQTRKGEWRRSGAGKVDVSTVTTTGNEIQFNTYSRLRQRIKSSELEGDR